MTLYGTIRDAAESWIRESLGVSDGYVVTCHPRNNGTIRVTIYEQNDDVVPVFLADAEVPIDSTPSAAMLSLAGGDVAKWSTFDFAR